jgi:hypothetical protein
MRHPSQTLARTWGGSHHDEKIQCPNSISYRPIEKLQLGEEGFYSIELSELFGAAAEPLPGSLADFCFAAF